MMGYSVADGESTLRPSYGDEGETLLNQIKKGNYRFPIIEERDAFTDAPYFFLWRNLDQNFPNSKFILTIRDEEEWIASVLKFYKDKPAQLLRQYYFGTCANPTISSACRTQWLERYQQHNQDVIQWFRTRPDDLLIMDLSKGDGWEPLARFLGKEPGVKKFPHANRRQGPIERGLRKIYHCFRAFGKKVKVD